MSSYPEKPSDFLYKLRKTYRIPDGQVEKYNGSPFDPSSLFRSRNSSNTAQLGNRRPATPTEIRALLQKNTRKDE